MEESCEHFATSASIAKCGGEVWQNGAKPASGIGAGFRGRTFTDTSYIPRHLSTPMLDILVIAPHPDDAELGMGGAILKFKQEGRRVGVLDLTSGEPTPHGTPELRVKETAAATKILGPRLARESRAAESLARSDDRESGEAGGSDSAAAAASGCLRRIGSMRIRIMWRRRNWWMMRGFGRKLTKTDMPGEPFHPARIYNYYCVHLKMAAQPAFVLDISEQWEQKLAAIRCFESQFITGRPTAAPTFLDQLRDEAAFWGKTIGTKYGEPFNCREPIGLTTMAGLV